MVSSIKLFGHEAPAVIPMMADPAGNQSWVMISRFFETICGATQERQDALSEAASRKDEIRCWLWAAITARIASNLEPLLIRFYRIGKFASTE